mmetsp:Transcript_27301/g.40441  ORF Transcript_27301/g.40441 Transcript_27301/m.40441 type:complete len:172 (-) Transcript_27301:89-604(-)
MKVSTIIALSSIGFSGAFSVSNTKAPSAVQKIAGAAATIAATLTLSANVATASIPATENDFISTSGSSTIIISSKDIGDPFALPSYSDSIKNVIGTIDVDSVNKKTMDEAKALREDKSVDQENNQRNIELRKQEEEEDKRMLRMKEYAKQEREEQIKREKAETAANRWNTF